MRADTFYSVPGPSLAVERARRGITQAALARAMFVSRQRVVSIEGAARVTVRTADRFQRALDLIAAQA